jgi:hypothetical protein
MNKMKKSKYLYRSHDFSIFINNGKDEYTHQMNVEKSWHGSYFSYECLKSFDFIECTENDLPELKKKHDLYYEYLNWTTRSDGHGGSKGGTMAEFLTKCNIK